MEQMSLKRIAELENKLECAPWSQPIKTDAYEMRQLLSLARKALEDDAAKLREAVEYIKTNSRDPFVAQLAARALAPAA